MRRLAIWIGWAALAVAAAFTTWLVLANRTTPLTTAVAPTHEVPDYTVSEAVVSKFGQDGGLRFLLDAKTIEHLPVSGASTLEQIRLYYYDPSGRRWRITAKHGRLSADGEHLALAGDVRARQLSLPNPLRFAAAEVQVGLKARTVRSTARVRIWQKGLQLVGIGLEADLATDVVRLDREVKGRYEP